MNKALLLGGDSFRGCFESFWIAGGFRLLGQQLREHIFSKQRLLCLLSGVEGLGVGHVRVDGFSAANAATLYLLPPRARSKMHEKRSLLFSCQSQEEEFRS